VTDAADGAQGLTKAIEEIPDLIISDLMMPSMDGIELCDRLKKNPKTSHVPIILLTAKAGIDDKVKGLETGADDYLIKPFNSDELKARVARLIDSRKKLHQYFSQKVAITASTLTVESIDDKFLNKLRMAIESRLGDATLSVEDVAMEVAMSTTQLYRKLKALTGQSPNELIRNMRLDRASLLLKQNAGNIADVAYSTGFNNLSYFSKVFKEKFGVTPSEFLKQGK
jgi:YesN/AraC family two-component response regulator